MAASAHAVIPADLLAEANRAPELRGRVRAEDVRVALACDGAVVGFCTPHRGTLGPLAWRLGPLYVRPAYRRRGLAKAAWEGYRDRVCVAFVADGNLASEGLHGACGFTRWRRGPGGWYWRREPCPSPS